MWMAENRQLSRGSPCNVSVSGQRLLPTDTQLQIKQILMGGEKSAPLSRLGKQTGGRSQVSSIFSAKPPFSWLERAEIPPDSKG